MPDPLKIALSRTERVIAVVPEPAAGPGWSNAPTWVYIHDPATGRLRSECIQPDERTPDLHALWSAGAAMQRALMEAVPTKRAKERSHA